MGPGNVFRAAERCLLPGQRLKPFILQDPVDGTDPVRTFGVSQRRQMIEIGMMMQQQCRHERSSKTAAVPTACSIRQ